MARLTVLSLILALAAPLAPLAAQEFPRAGDDAAEVTALSHALHSAARQGDREAVEAHMSEEAAAALVRGWDAVPERFRRVGDTIEETGSYSRRVESGLCDWDFTEPKTERQARDRLFCTPARATPAYFLERGAYRVVWARSAEGGWKVRTVELTPRRDGP